jgi:AcrR family transcriptional regulator
MFFEMIRGVEADERGRISQKRRTREDLLRAARRIREEGGVPSVGDVADAAGISRATAYRYFPTQESLLAEASARPLIEGVASAIAAAADIDDVVERVDRIFARAAPLLIKHEAELRALLKLSLEHTLSESNERDIPLLSGRWVEVWDEALEPIRERVSSVRYARMVRAIGTLLGVEAITVMRDACHGDEAATARELRAAARAMIRGFLAELPDAAPPEVNGRKRSAAHREQQ